MCSNFEQYARSEGLNPFEDFDATTIGDHRRRIRPTDMAWTIDTTGVHERSWSLIPSWSDSPRPQFATFNARVETVREKPSFREAWSRQQRCLIPISAWFEWPLLQGRKTPYRIRPRTEAPIWVAGLWNDWSNDAEIRPSFTMLTSAAREDLQRLHPRMPLILDRNHATIWLQGSLEAATALLRSETRLRLECEPESNQADLFL